jgi:transposase
MQITTIGLDLAKHVFQIHGVDAQGQVVLRKRLRRAEVIPFFTGLAPCLVGMEACATSHHWARELMALGHTVKMMPPSYVKPYVRRGKNDATDAQAICEAVARPSMRFVPVKSADQQSVLMLHRVRALMIRQRTMLVNALRGHLAEFGIIVAQGVRRIRDLIAMLTGEDAPVPALSRAALAPLVEQLMDLELRVRSSRLNCSPGIGAVKRAGGWRRYRAWASSRRRLSRRQ